MKSIWIIAAAAIFPVFIGIAYLAHGRDATPLQCEQSVAQWSAWRDSSVKELMTPTFKSDSGELVIDPNVVNTLSLKDWQHISDCSKVSPSTFSIGSPVRTAIANFYNFISVSHWMAVTDESGKRTHNLGLTMPDKDYFNMAQPYLTFPSRMLQNDFLTALDSPSTYAAALKIISDHNSDPINASDQWIAIPFRAQFIKTVGTTDRTYGRLLVLARGQPGPNGGKIDKWILWGLVTPDMPQNTPMHNVSMFSVYTAPSGAQTTYFSDFWRSLDANGNHVISSTVFMDPEPSSNCYACHKSSILPIYPKIEYKLDASGSLIAKGAGDALLAPQVNRVMRGYGPPNFGTDSAGNALMDTLSFGPPMGAAATQRTDSFIQACAPTLPASSISRVKSAMNCESCHGERADGMYELGRFNYLMAVRSQRDVGTTFEARESPIATFVRQGWMPPGANLSSDEKSALAQCVLKEYYDPQTQQGTFVDWLLQRS